jgi:hypothetical protein
LVSKTGPLFFCEFSVFRGVVVVECLGVCVTEHVRIDALLDGHVVRSQCELRSPRLEQGHVGHM